VTKETILCPCGAPVTKIRGKFCNPCGKERNRLANIASYYRNKQGWKPYNKKCACGVEFLVENRRQGKRIDCAECKKKRRYPSTSKTPTAPNKNKSSKRRIKCKCPNQISESCKKTYHRQMLVHESVDLNKPFRKTCKHCQMAMSQYEYCPEADGYGVGVM